MRPAARLVIVALLGLSVLGFRPVEVVPSQLPPADDVKVRTVEAAYATAWVKDDPAAILATLWPDAVLIPPGHAPVRGADEIRRFWWPTGGPKTTVTLFESTVVQVGGSGSTAFALSTYRFDFSWEDGGKKTERSSRGNALMLFRRNAGGEWRISHRMWSNLPP